MLICNEESNGVPAIHTLSDATPFKRDFHSWYGKNEEYVRQKGTVPRSTNPEENE